uniref:PA n=1 Tax=Pseudomonas phage phi7 TaxID=90888 RepID=Q9XJN6_9VIRU|nr:PA [Pseudomonas phage phi7]
MSNKRKPLPDALLAPLVEPFQSDEQRFITREEVLKRCREAIQLGEELIKLSEPSDKRSLKTNPFSG